MTLRKSTPRPRPGAITRHPDQPGRAAAAAHTGPPGSAHRVSLLAACLQPASLDPYLAGRCRR